MEKTIPQIIDELNLENGSNYKMDVLKKYQDNLLLQKVLKMTYDKVAFTYGLTMKNVPEVTMHGDMDFNTALEILEERFATRMWSGNKALGELHNVLSALSEEDALIVERIINRDLRLNIGRTNINKVWKNLITRPPYQRCDIGTKANVEKNINFKQKVYSNLKMDGTYRSCLNDAGITFMSRSGQEDSFPILEGLMKYMPEGYVYLGELTLANAKQRSAGNGLINSDNPPHGEIVFTIWDMVPVNEYNQKNGTSLYEDRFEMLQDALKNIANLDIDKNVQLVPFKIVKNMKEAFAHFQEVTELGFEGTVIKSHDMKWKDGTSKQQLKVKLDIDLEVRVTGFTEGKPGTKRAKTFGAMTFETDDKRIQGRCSGFTDKKLLEINADRDAWIGKIITVRCNDITKGRNNEHFALSHPRFIEERVDRTTTDTLERALETKDLAMEMK